MAFRKAHTSILQDFLFWNTYSTIQYEIHFSNFLFWNTFNNTTCNSFSKALCMVNSIPSKLIFPEWYFNLSKRKTISRLPHLFRIVFLRSLFPDSISGDLTFNVYPICTSNKASRRTHTNTQ
ncbi:hypothetical protein V8G54_014408 [Vigna mungo]|uniref:Uncharacterized protein n=1 Tax=Vigna mungo TaxID=3915 RepID=A0AAQ3NKJ2_VIGMU